MKIKVCGMRDAENIAAVARLKPDYMGFVFYERSPRWAGDMSPDVLDSLDELSPETRRVGVFVDADEEYILQTARRFKLDFVQLHGHESPEACRRIGTRLKAETMTAAAAMTAAMTAAEAETGRAARSCGVIKAFGMAVRDDLLQVADYEGVCDYFLFDTRIVGRGTDRSAKFENGDGCDSGGIGSGSRRGGGSDAGAFGGTGRRFDHSLLADYRGCTPFFLSGGIGPEDGVDIGIKCSDSQIYARCVAVDVNSRFETAPGVKDPGLMKIFFKAIRGGVET